MSAPARFWATLAGQSIFDLSTMKNLLLALFVSAIFGGMPFLPVQAQDSLPVHAAPANAQVYIISPADGATVDKNFTVRFGLRGMGVAPSGVERDATGHHHLLIDAAELPAAGQPIPSDAHHVHFGGGQTQTTLTLEPGTHTLQLELADANHIPFDPPLVSDKITIHVE